MSLLRPLDPKFPIERQIAIEAGPVILVNPFTLDKADEQAFLKIWAARCCFYEAATGLHLNPASSRDRRKPHLLELCGLAIDRLFSRRIHASRVPGETLRASKFGCRFSAPVPEVAPPEPCRVVVRGWSKL